MGSNTPRRRHSTHHTPYLGLTWGVPTAASSAATPLFSAGLLAAFLCACVSPPGPSRGPTAIPSPTTVNATATPLVLPPQVGATQRWIEVDLAAQIVRLKEGSSTLAEYPAATGVAISTETATHPGRFQVQQLIEGPIENVPGVYVSDILVYDVAAGMGIHSMPMDEGGRVLDGTLGTPASGGCVRVGEAHAVFEFARLGTVIWIH